MSGQSKQPVEQAVEAVEQSPQRGASAPRLSFLATPVRVACALLALSVGVLGGPWGLAALVAAAVATALIYAASSLLGCAPLPRSTGELGRRCPLCHDDLAPGEVVVSCGGCETVYHSECRAEFQGCALLGCDAPRVVSRRFELGRGLVGPEVHPDAIDLGQGLVTPFPFAPGYDPDTGLRLTERA